MLNLEPLAIDHDAVFLQIAGSKRGERKDRLLALAPEISRDFSKYMAATNSLATIVSAGYDSDQSNDLRDCYKGRTDALEQLLARIRWSQSTIAQTKCQYCEIGSPDTFDHYLPEGTFPEYSVLALNLVPCCHLCNSKKSNIFLVSGQRQFLNLYF